VEVRNIRFRLSTDGMKPFGETGSSHSTWPLTLCIHNLPSWLCMKRKFIMMPLLIGGPVQFTEDIDVYLQTLIDDILVLWEKEGIRMWDEFQQQHFNLRAMLFITIQDGSGLGSISGKAFKGYKGCTWCMDETGEQITRTKKIRKFLMGQLRNVMPQRFTVGNTCLVWSRILKLFLERGKEEKVKRHRRRERMQRIMVTKLQDCSKKIKILEPTILEGLDGAACN
jgi:hypothetical protein